MIESVYWCGGHSLSINAMACFILVKLQQWRMLGLIQQPFRYRFAGYVLVVWKGRMLRPLVGLWAWLNMLRNLPKVIVMDVVYGFGSTSILRSHRVKVGYWICEILKHNGSHLNINACLFSTIGVGSWSMMGWNEAICKWSRYFTNGRTTIWGLDVCHHREVWCTRCCEE